MKKLKEFINESLNNIEFKSIKSLSELEQILKKTNTNVSKKEGFWLFGEALEKDKKAYGNISKKPWFIEYSVLLDNDKIEGIVSYSLKKEYKEYVDDFDLGSNIHVFDIQSLKRGKGYTKSYFDYIEKIGKENNKTCITLQPYEDWLIKHYEKIGFKVIDDEYKFMVKKI